MVLNVLESRAPAISKYSLAFPASGCNLIGLVALQISMNNFLLRLLNVYNTPYQLLNDDVIDAFILFILTTLPRILDMTFPAFNHFLWNSAIDLSGGAGGADGVGSFNSSSRSFVMLFIKLSGVLVLS